MPLLLKLLFFTAVRVGELVKIEVADLDLAACKIFVDQGKGSKDRYILFPQTFGLVLRVQQIVQRYREAAGLSTAVHPHLFRHQMLTLC